MGTRQIPLATAYTCMGVAVGIALVHKLCFKLYGIALRKTWVVHLEVESHLGKELHATRCRIKGVEG